MALSLQALLDRAEAFCAERESLRARAAPATPLPFRSLFAEFSELSREETLAFARSHPAALPLVPFLARCCEEADALEVSERIDTVERTGSISLGEGTLPFRAARERMARETDRPARAAVARGLDRFLWEQRDAYAARCRRATETAARLGFDTYAAFREQAGLQARLPLEELSTFLRLTEDAYRDVLGYALKKLGADVRALPSGSAQLHDALAAMNAPWMAAHFRREDAGGALDRTFDAWGLLPRAHGRIRLDAAADAPAGSSPVTAAIEVPGKVRLVMPSTSGLSGYGEALQAWGRALFFANIDPQQPGERRRFGDASVTEGYAALAKNLLTDEQWLRRYLRLPQMPARDASKLAALGTLWALRRHCALAAYQPVVYERGPEGARAEAYQTGLTEVLYVEVPRGHYLVDAELRHQTPTALSGAGWAAVLHRTLQTRFNEDYWRNPAAGTWLKALFARGQPAQATELAELTGSAVPSLVEAGRLLVSVLNV